MVYCLSLDTVQFHPRENGNPWRQFHNEWYSRQWSGIPHAGSWPAKKGKTSRQLIALLSIATSDLPSRESIKKKACPSYRKGVDVDVTNLPLHSYYIDSEDLKYPEQPEDALKSRSIPDWESAKKVWLLEHMWWQEFGLGTWSCRKWVSEKKRLKGLKY